MILEFVTKKKIDYEHQKPRMQEPWEQPDPSVRGSVPSVRVRQDQSWPGQLHALLLDDLNQHLHVRQSGIGSLSTLEQLPQRDAQSPGETYPQCTTDRL